MNVFKYCRLIGIIVLSSLGLLDAAMYEALAQRRAARDSIRVKKENAMGSRTRMSARRSAARDSSQIKNEIMTGSRTRAARRRATARPPQPPAPPVQDFVPITDRWEEIKPPEYELNVKGRWHDPFNQNKLKGDYPIIGQNTFLILTAATDNFLESSWLPTPSGVSTANAQSANFFGNGRRFLAIENLRFTIDLYQGNVAFKPRDWELRITPVFNLNYIDLNENNTLRISPRSRTDRTDRQLAFQELSLEKHLFNVSDRFDFISFKGGIQRMFSDFRGFIFSDFNLGGRLFGNLSSNHYQYNLAYFYMLEKDTNSELNTVFDDRQQQVYLANIYKQDFLTLGYTGQWSFHYNKDRASVYYDTNGFPTRPALLGAAIPHTVNAYYLGWTGDGHFGRLNLNHALYQVFGNDTRNQLAGQRIRINAQMAALELSLDKDWKRYRASVFYASGDARPLDGVGRGFDTIVDQPFFAGGTFSFWNLQGIRLQGVNLVNRFSLVPNLRSSKTQGQPNFVNPGLLLFNLAWDADWTPKLRTVLNANYLRFVNTAPLQQFLNQSAIRNDIGLDYGLGIIYRPFLNNNAIFTISASALTPFGGFSDIYQSPRTLYSVFTSFVFTY
ncbi:hypothetical protein DCC62_15530 [candidate division KSB1 bacterium]|nr:MAG: hypothetical protein DCC62_15530 [candidate division KSB1 bacterium]